MADQYWASLPTEEAAAEVSSRIEAYYRFLETSVVHRLALMSWRLLHGLSNKDTGNAFNVTRGGVKGELARLRVNHFGAHLNMRVTLATQQKPAWVPVPTNTDAKSQSAALIADSFLDYQYRDKRIGRRLHKAGYTCQWSGEAYTFGTWDPKRGEAVAADPESGEAVNEGDIILYSLCHEDVARDPSASSYEASPWKVARVPNNKWDLASRYTEKADELTALTPTDPYSRGAESFRIQGVESDEVWVYHFIHEKTDALPDGRYLVTAGRDIVLFDGPLPYRTTPLMRCAEAEWEGSPFGRSSMWNALGPQEAHDLLTSTATTNLLGLATNKIVTVKGSGIKARQLTQALENIEVISKDHIPTVLNGLATTEPQVFQFRDKLSQELGIMSSVNETSMGVVNPNVKSGSMAALYDAAALRAANGLQEAIHRHAEDIGTFIVHAWADFAPRTEKNISVVGEFNRPMMLSLTPDDLNSIDRVTVELVDAAAKSFAQRQAQAEALLNSGALSAQNDVVAQRYLMVLKTGELDNLTEASNRQSIQIRQACERLAKGQRNTVLITDPHWLAIPEKLGVLSSEEARQNPGIVQAVTAEVQEHAALWRQMPPDIMAALGAPPPPPLPGMAPGGTPQPQQGPQGATQPPQQGPQASTLPADMPSQPSMPTNPATGEQHDPSEGALA